MKESPETKLILKVEDPNVIVKGEIPKEVAQQLIEEVWMPIKKNQLPIERSVVMLPPAYDPKTDLTTFNFLVNSLSVKTDAYDEAIYDHLIQEAITAFVDALIGYYDSQYMSSFNNEFGESPSYA